MNGYGLPHPPDSCSPYGSAAGRVGASKHPMEEFRVYAKRFICAAAVAGGLVTAAPAMAAPNTYCVLKPSCDGIDVGDVQSALDMAKAHPGSDVVELGSGDFITALSYSYTAIPHNPVNIVGNGAGNTRLATTQSGSNTTLTLGRGSVTDLEVSAPPSPNIADFSVALDLRGRAERLKLTGGWVNAVLSNGAKLMTSTLTDGGLDYDRPAVLVQSGNATVSDSTIDATTLAVKVEDTGILRLTRSSVISHDGVVALDGGGAEIRDSLIRGRGLHSTGLAAYADTKTAGLYATNVTVVGSGTEGGAGVLSYADGNGIQANVEVRNSVITRSSVPLRRTSMNKFGHAFLKVTNSAYEPTTVISEGEGTYEAPAGNVSEAPGFVDAPGNDFHLGDGSPLIDAGEPEPNGGLSELDRDGLARSVDGNGDGTVAPDIGAFEHAAAPVPPGPGEEPPDDTPGPGEADLTAPVVSSLSLTHRRVRVVRGSARRPRGTVFRFRLSEDARVTVAFSHRVKGKRRAAGKLVRDAKAGKNRIRFRGRVGERRLKSGRYTAAVRATDAAGNRSVVRRIRFRVVR